MEPTLHLTLVGFVVLAAATVRAADREPSLRPGRAPVKATASEALGAPPGPCGPLFLTQSVDPLTIQPLNSIACQGPDGVNENSYYRVFSELPSPFLPCAIEVGVESATSGQMGRSASIELRLYDTRAIGALPTPIFSAAYDVANQPPSVQSFDVSNSPAILSGGLVVEIFVPAAEGPGGPDFIIGSNDAGEIAPGYLRAPQCNVKVPTPLSQIGFPDMHLVINVIGDGEPIQPSCPGDTNGDGLVNVTDLINVIGTWGTSGQGKGFDADLDGNGVVDVTDLIMLISGWGVCPGVTRACCFEDGTCLDLTSIVCLEQGGAVRAANSSCATVACFDTTGACCFPGGTCEELVPSACTELGGSHQGPGTACALGLCAPNPNDLCIDALLLDLSAGPVTEIGQTLASTSDPEAFACPSDNPIESPGNWYRVIGSGESISATLCANTDFDTKLHLYCGASCGSLSCVTGDDDGCGDVDGPAKLRWCSEAGQPYYLLVSGGAGSTGSYQLTVTPDEACGQPNPCLIDNDLCTSAIDIAPGETVLVDNLDASLDDVRACGGGEQSGPGVWLRAVGDGTSLTARLCNPTPEDLDTRLTVFCGPCTDLECVGIEPSDNAQCAPLTEEITWCSDPGAEYYLLVSGAELSERGSVEVSLTSDGLGCADIPCQCQLCPTNDDCANAQPVGLGAIPFDTTFATTGGPSLPATCNEGSGLSFVQDVWFLYTPASTGTLTVSTCNLADFDTRLAVYEGGCPGLVLAACNDDAVGCAGFTSFLLVPVTQGVPVRIRVGGFNGGGTGLLSLTQP